MKAEGAHAVLDEENFEAYCEEAHSHVEDAGLHFEEAHEQARWSQEPQHCPSEVENFQSC